MQLICFFLFFLLLRRRKLVGVAWGLKEETYKEMNGAYEGEKGGRECESKIWCEQATHRFKGLLR